MQRAACNMQQASTPSVLMTCRLGLGLGLELELMNEEKGSSRCLNIDSRYLKAFMDYLTQLP